MIRTLEELRKLLDDFEVEHAQEMLEHPSWIILETSTAHVGDEPAAMGPFPSAVAAFEAVVKLERIRQSAPMHDALVAVHGESVFRVVPLWSEL
jgi:hypothetical protein